MNNYTERNLNKVSGTHFDIVNTLNIVTWDGRYLKNRLGEKIKCIKKLGNYRLYVNNTISMDGSPNEKEYFIVDKRRTSKILRYNGEIKRGTGRQIIEFMENFLTWGN